MPQKIAEPMDLIHSWLEEFRADKRASQKRSADDTAGGDNTEPTTHPVMDADPQTAPANEGARAKENTSDVGDQIGGDTVTGQSDATTATSDQPSDEMGTKKMDADQVRGNIKDPKSTKDDPGSACPATVGQDKYGEMRKASEFVLQYFANLGVKEAQTAVSKKAEEEKEDDEKEGPGEDETEEHEEAEGESVSEEEKKAAIGKYPDDFDNGFVAAAMVLQQMGLSKQAEDTTDALINDHISSIVATARADADNAIDYLEGFAKGAAVKQAAAEMPPITPEMLAGVEGGEGGEGGEGDEAAAQEAMASEELPEEGGGEGEMVPEMGGEMAPEMGGEGVGGEEAGGDASEDAIIQALAEAGVTPEELEAALAEAGGGGGGEAGGELPPEVAKAASAFQKKVAKYTNKKRLYQMLRG
jgi:hypothetical protein